MAKTHSQSNRLKDEKSPYLLQHANNPVDWYPWCDEAFARARLEEKPVLISIGYSACHWCHVMERESFEDNEVARIMNGRFVSVKVDREERPAVDSLYMKAVQAMGVQGGWPLTVFATPEGVPFYGGSYFPPEDSHGLPAFRKVLLAVSEAYKNNKQKVEEVTSSIKQALSGAAPAQAVSIGPELSMDAFEAARSYFDQAHGGFGNATKFPYSMFLRFLLKYYGRTGDKNALAIVRKTLTAMAEGGICDHVGGGFHRYSVDQRWDVPHYEKMLYDNGQLAGLYARASEVTGSPFYRETAIDTIDYMLRELRDGGGGFYAAEDADVDGVEGEYYLWDYQEIVGVLGQKATEKLASSYTITPAGNFDGRNSLRMKHGVRNGDEPVPPDMKEMLAALLKARSLRARPKTDRKIITAWNGLAIEALAETGRVLGRDDFIGAAKECASFVLSSVRGPGGRLMRYYLGGVSSVKAHLEDYAILALSLLSLNEATGEEGWLTEARLLTEDMIRLFYDAEEKAFYDTGADDERLFARARDLIDNDLPSGNSAAAALLLRAAVLFGRPEYRALAVGIVAGAGGAGGAMREPLSHGNLLCVHESVLGGG